MATFAANLSTLFNEVPFLDRFERAARAGFSVVEFQFPYAHPAADIRARLDAHGQTAVLLNLPIGEDEAGRRGVACLPGREDEFRAGLERGIEYARTLGVRQLHCMAGIAPAAADAGLLRRTYVANLRLAAREVEALGARILIEPLNVYDVPGYYLRSTAQALAVLDEVDADNVFVQYDIYHAQRNEGELAATVEKHLARIGHIQIADNPGRHEPGSGEINFDFLIGHLDRIGYSGYVGCEYFPAAGTEAGLGWLQRFTPRRAAT
jgi:hydroxypyruvate isomerase